MSGGISNYGASTSSNRQSSERRPSTGRLGSNWNGRDKGKGRARDVEGSDDGEERRNGNGAIDDNETMRGISFCVRFTDGTTEDLVDLYVNDSESIREVKRRIRILRPSLATNKLRLIYTGRILTDGVRLVSYIASLLKRQDEQERRTARGNFGDLIEGVVNRAVQSLEDGASPEGHSDGGNSHQRQASMNPFEGSLDSKTSPTNSKSKGKSREKDSHEPQDVTKGRKIWLHCSVGEPGSLEEETQATEQPQPAANAPLTGFDRLREAGFSEDEIANIREQFHVDGPSDTVVAGDQDEHARALEEQWMDNLGTGGADPSSPEAGMYTVLFKGVIAGFFFPFLPLFFFRAEEGEPALFSKRMQMAIAAGLSINLLYGALRAIS